jgi:hypothetical protein
MVRRIIGSERVGKWKDYITKEIIILTSASIQDGLSIQQLKNKKYIQNLVGKLGRKRKQRPVCETNA